MTQFDFAQARFNMVEQQVRPWEVLNQQVLDLMLEIPREDFVPAPYKALAYTDTEIPLGEGEVMLPPKLHGRIWQALAPDLGDSVLEVGTGSGYLTAMLARVTQHVHSLDIMPRFTEMAGNNLSALGLDNISLETADALNNQAHRNSYDLIVLTGSLPELDKRFQEQLNPGGRLFVVLGQPPIMEACLITRTGTAEWYTDYLFETQIPPLRGALKKPEFVF